MKKISFLVPILVLLIGITSCKKDDSPSFVDDYSPNLTEEKGTEHTGDYFPVEEGYSWYYTGNQILTGEVKYSAAGQSKTEPINESAPVYSSVLVEPLTSVTLESGTYMLYPVYDNSGESYAYRYYEKNNDGVYFKAFTSELGEIVEVENPVFIKKPLVVGDSWEAQPTVDLNAGLGNGELDDFLDGDIDATINCKMYVIGIENINWNGGSVSPIRMDQRAEANVSVPFNQDGGSGTINMNLKMTAILHLLEDIGVIKQDTDMDMVINASVSMEGQKFSMNMDLNIKGLLELETYDVTGSVTKNSVKITDKNGLELNIDDYPEVYKKVIKQSLEISKIIKKLF